jgi:hypothetical protein
MNPEGLETNLHYANFLYATKDFKSAFQHATTAASSLPLKGRESADKALRREASRLVSVVLERL